MLLTHIAEAYTVVKAVGSPSVRLIFDTSHVQIMDGDLLGNMRETWDTVALIQLADNPHRLEPGSGEINFENILRTIRELGYTGLVELEHDWSVPGRETEERGIEYLRYLDKKISANAPEFR
jgi:hydroxypyruvate isomerase